MDSFLAYAAAKQPEIVALIREFVQCESPSGDPAAVARFVALVSDAIAPFATLKTHPGGHFGPHLTAEMHLPGRKKSGQVLVLGHSDTVWPRPRPIVA